MAERGAPRLSDDVLEAAVLQMRNVLTFRSVSRAMTDAMTAVTGERLASYRERNWCACKSTAGGLRADLCRKWQELVHCANGRQRGLFHDIVKSLIGVMVLNDDDAPVRERSEESSLVHSEDCPCYADTRENGCDADVEDDDDEDDDDEDDDDEDDDDEDYDDEDYDDDDDEDDDEEDDEDEDDASGSDKQSTDDEESYCFEHFVALTKKINAKDQKDSSKVYKTYYTESKYTVWNPMLNSNVFASGSDDGCLRVWSTSDKPSLRNGYCVEMNRKNRSKFNVSALNWSRKGTFLASATYDGLVEIIVTNGHISKTIRVIDIHKASVFSLKFNSTEQYILTGCCDQTSIVWDIINNKMVQVFDCHKAAVLDVEWISDDHCVTADLDGVIHVNKLGLSGPYLTLKGHTDTVHVLRYDFRANLLASCSSDTTIKLWDAKSDTCVLNLKDHLYSVHTVKWNPSNNSLASASADSTVRLWDVGEGVCLNVIKNHIGSALSIDFSPDGKLLASGGLDRRLNIWSKDSGKLVKTFTSPDVVHKVGWSSSGNFVSTCSYNGKVFVYDLRKD